MNHQEDKSVMALAVPKRAWRRSILGAGVAAWAGGSWGLASAQTSTSPARLSIAAACTTRPLSSMGVYSVVDYGAGVGQADQDTAAFKAALNAAKVANGTVVIPEGTYYINDTLSMTGKVSLVGLVAGSLATGDNRSRVVLQMVGSAFASTDVPADVSANGDALAAYNVEGQQGQRPLRRALLELEGGCAAGGFTVIGLGQAVANAAVAMMGNSTGVRLSNLHLRNVWIGIFSHDSLGRSIIEDCLISDVQRTGICCGAYGGGSFDVSRMTRIEIQAASGVKNTNTSVGMVLGHFDGHEVNDCTVSGFYTGIKLTSRDVICQHTKHQLDFVCRLPSSKQFLCAAVVHKQYQLQLGGRRAAGRCAGLGPLGCAQFHCAICAAQEPVRCCGLCSIEFGEFGSVQLHFGVRCALCRFFQQLGRLGGRRVCGRPWSRPNGASSCCDQHGGICPGRWFGLGGGLFQHCQSLSNSNENSTRFKFLR